MSAPNPRAIEIAQQPGVIHCFDPATRELLGTVPVHDADAVGGVVRRARAAQRGWASSSFALRRRVLRRLGELVLDQAEQLCELIVRDCGKTRENALMGEIWTVCEKLRWTTVHGPKHLRPEPVSPGLLLHKKARLEFHPRGVMGAILPWNYPLQNILNPVIPALMAGNAIVVKPSEWVAWSAAPIVEMVQRALRDEGQDPDLVQVVQGFAPTGRALIEASVDGLVFIGSAANGRQVLEAAASRLTPVTMELGGKDPFVVCDDADLEQAAHAAMAGCFINAGQNCVASERLLVFDAVYDAFEKRVFRLVSGLRQGPSRRNSTVDVGAMVTPVQLEVVDALVRKAVQAGARIVCGGHRVLSEQGEFFAPTILADVTADMAIMREETFGPVMLLCRVRDEHEAVAVANNTRFGLSSSVFSRDLARARRISKRIETGMAAINEFGGMTYMAQDLTFGGVKGSGFGRINGRDGLRACCNVKAVLDDRIGGLHFVNRLFPVQAGDFKRVQAAVDLVYRRSAGRKLRAFGDLIRSLRSRS